MYLVKFLSYQALKGFKKTSEESMSLVQVISVENN